MLCRVSSSLLRITVALALSIAGAGLADTLVAEGASAAVAVHPGPGAGHYARPAAHRTARRRTPRERAHVATRVRITVHRAPGHTGAGRRSGKAPSVPTPPFTQCPAVGLDTSCGILLVIGDSANAVYGDPSQGPFDGVEDTLIGVQNTSSSTVNSIALSSNTNLFGFDGDGLCTASPAPAACPFGPTGYEGPSTDFTYVTPDQTGGVVTFTGGLAPGATAYFSLEEPLAATDVIIGGPSAAEQGGPFNPSENPTTCSTPHPVNCATGVFWHTFADFMVPGRGVPLSFSRTYSSSQAAVDGPLGYGWTFNYGMSLSTDNSGNVTITQEDGSTVTFVPNGSGGFSPPPRVLATLVQNTDGSYTFTRNQSATVSYNFSSTGQLQTITDLNGYTTTLAYMNGQLATVTDPAGRQLTFTWNGSHIASVTDPMGRTMSFAGTASGNELASPGATWRHNDRHGGHAVPGGGRAGRRTRRARQ
jgi:YD repeat-containing protein